MHERMHERTRCFAGHSQKYIFKLLLTGVYRRQLGIRPTPPFNFNPG